MKLSISYKNVQSHPAVEKEVEQCTGKLKRLLQSYEPDLVQLHGVFSKNPRFEQYSLALNLILPTATLHATGTGANTLAGCKDAFSELQGQVKKLQSRLRRDHEWKRKRPRARLAAPAVQVAD